MVVQFKVRAAGECGAGREAEMGGSIHSHGILHLSSVGLACYSGACHCGAARKQAANKSLSPPPESAAPLHAASAARAS